jgi:hypothetical protein
MARLMRDSVAIYGDTSLVIESHGCPGCRVHRETIMSASATPWGANTKIGANIILNIHPTTIIPHQHQPQTLNTITTMASLRTSITRTIATASPRRAAATTTAVLRGTAAAGPSRLTSPASSPQRRGYHAKVIDHYENPRNVGTLNKNDVDVGTGLVGAPGEFFSSTRGGWRQRPRLILITHPRT